MSILKLQDEGVKKIRVTLKKSLIGKIPKHRATLKALGLKKIGRSREIDMSNKALVGMVKEVEYMLNIEVIE
ncbi:MAG: 50S ribosomal protein L30 [Leptospiraceae bacterium]|nr:50S ribosomal protein L30 [Leptospiraceae bacterium]MDW7975189.1 50S ribosomal protein L30 [Leptospiraceae bacterium]